MTKEPMNHHIKKKLSKGAPKFGAQIIKNRFTFKMSRIDPFEKINLNAQQKIYR